jgi:hypothetical protein
MLRVIENEFLRRKSGPERKEVTVRTRNFVVITLIVVRSAGHVIYVVDKSASRKLERLLLR